MSDDVRTDNNRNRARGCGDAYAAKESRYFAGARPDMIALLPSNPSAVVLEVGCGHGGTGVMALDSGKCRSYCAVELFEGAAAIAAQRLTEVHVGDVEKMSFPWAPGSFDTLIMSEVLEHLVDPPGTLRRLGQLLKPGATVLASSPNASHYEIILMLLRGDWRAADSGPMDRTHLRWFTPRSYRQMFESCGFVVDDVTSVARDGWKAKAIRHLSFGVASHLVTRQIMLRGHRK